VAAHVRVAFRPVPSYTAQCPASGLPERVPTHTTGGACLPGFDASSIRSRSEACSAAASGNWLAARRVLSAGKKMEVHPAALPLDLVVIFSRVKW
jgi:hypothetical protein